jgi:hypothetical protein
MIAAQESSGPNNVRLWFSSGCRFEFGGVASQRTKCADVETQYCGVLLTLANASP